MMGSKKRQCDEYRTSSAPVHTFAHRPNNRRVGNRVETGQVVGGREDEVGQERAVDLAIKQHASAEGVHQRSMQHLSRLRELSRNIVSVNGGIAEIGEVAKYSTFPRANSASDCDSIHTTTVAIYLPRPIRRVYAIRHELRSARPLASHLTLTKKPRRSCDRRGFLR